jgi:hypothetical protein
VPSVAPVKMDFRTGIKKGNPYISLHPLYGSKKIYMVVLFSALPFFYSALSQIQFSQMFRDIQVTGHFKSQISNFKSQIITLTTQQ